MNLRRVLGEFLRNLSSKSRAFALNPVSQIFFAVLGRAPSPQERRSLTFKLFFKPFRGRDMIEAAIRSEEFAVMQLPHLLARYSKDFANERKVFFVHIPKTSGTALRMALIEELGIPALDFYGRTDEQFPALGTHPFLEFWPLITGHMNVFGGPHQSHTVMTTLREPRVRRLSQFRQHTRIAYERGLHQKAVEPFLVRAGKTFTARRRESNFSHWLRSTTSFQLSYFADPLSEPFLAHLPEEEIKALSRTGLLNFISTTLNEMSEANVQVVAAQAAAALDVVNWSHASAIEAVLAQLSQPRSQRQAIPRANDSLHQDKLKTVVVTREDLALLNRVAEVDNVFFEALIALNKLPKAPMDPDMEFGKEARRLGFALP